VNPSPRTRAPRTRIRGRVAAVAIIAAAVVASWLLLEGPGVEVLRRRLGIAAAARAQDAAAAASDAARAPAAAARVNVLYTVNNLGYTSTCG